MRTKLFTAYAPGIHSLFPELVTTTLFRGTLRSDSGEAWDCLLASTDQGTAIAVSRRPNSQKREKRASGRGKPAGKRGDSR